MKDTQDKAKRKAIKKIKQQEAEEKLQGLKNNRSKEKAVRKAE